MDDTNPSNSQPTVPQTPPSVEPPQPIPNEPTYVSSINQPPTPPSPAQPVTPSINMSSPSWETQQQPISPPIGSVPPDASPTPPTFTPPPPPAMETPPPPPGPKMGMKKNIVIIAVIIGIVVIAGGIAVVLMGQNQSAAPASTSAQPTSGTEPSPTTIPTLTIVPSPASSNSAEPAMMASGSSSLRKTSSGTIGIEVLKPQPNSMIVSPATVSGQANVFEGHVNIRIKDANGGVLGNGFGTGCMGDKPCPFSTTITFTSAKTGSGWVEAYSVNAGTGAEQDLVKIPVLFSTKK